MSRHGQVSAASRPEIETFAENLGALTREVFGHEELARLAGVLNEMEESEEITVYSAAALRLLIFTGARRGEVLTLQWEHVKLEASRLDLPESKTGKKTIYLSAPAKQLMAELPQIAGNPYVIAGGKPGQHLVNL